MTLRPALPTRDARLEVVRGASLLFLFALQGAGTPASTALLGAQAAVVLTLSMVAGRVFDRTLQRHGFAACCGHLARRAAQHALAFAALGALLLALRFAGALDAGTLSTWRASPQAPVQMLLPLPGDPLLYQWRECLLLRAGPVPLQLLALSAWLLLLTPGLLWLMLQPRRGVPALVMLACAGASATGTWTSAPFETLHPMGPWLGLWLVGLLLGTRWDCLSRPSVCSLTPAVAASRQVGLLNALLAWVRLPAQWPLLAWWVHGAALLLLALVPSLAAGGAAASAVALGLVVAAVRLAERRQTRRRLELAPT